MASLTALNLPQPLDLLSSFLSSKPGGRCDIYTITISETCGLQVTPGRTRTYGSKSVIKYEKNGKAIAREIFDRVIAEARKRGNCIFWYVGPDSNSRPLSERIHQVQVSDDIRTQNLSRFQINHFDYKEVYCVFRRGNHPSPS